MRFATFFRSYTWAGSCMSCNILLAFIADFQFVVLFIFNDLFKHQSPPFVLKINSSLFIIMEDVIACNNNNVFVKTYLVEKLICSVLVWMCLFSMNQQYIFLYFSRGKLSKVINFD